MHFKALDLHSFEKTSLTLSGNFMHNHFYQSFQSECRWSTPQKMDGHTISFCCLQPTKASSLLDIGKLSCNTSPCCHGQACRTLGNINLNILLEICERGSGEISVSDKFPDRVNAFIFLCSNLEILSDLETINGPGMRKVIRVQRWKVKRKN